MIASDVPARLETEDASGLGLGRRTLTRAIEGETDDLLAASGEKLRKGNPTTRTGPLDEDFDRCPFLASLDSTAIDAETVKRDAHVVVAGVCGEERRCRSTAIFPRHHVTASVERCRMDRGGEPHLGALPVDLQRRRRRLIARRGTQPRCDQHRQESSSYECGGPAHEGEGYRNGVGSRQQAVVGSQFFIAA